MQAFKTYEEFVHPLVMASEEAATTGGDDDRWDAWSKWILPWLWSCVYTICVNTPYDLFKWCWKMFWDWIKYGATYGFGF